jgi:hypothetical protein
VTTDESQRFAPMSANLAQKIADAAYDVAGLCTNNSANYRNLSYVKKRIAKKEKCRSRAGGKCYGAVKAALRTAGATDVPSEGVPASSAHTSGTLKAAGFRKVPNCDSSTAPVGAVLVFKGGRYGHIEVNTGLGYCSDFCRDEPIDKYARRTLIACYVK